MSTALQFLDVDLLVISAFTSKAQTSGQSPNHNASALANRFGPWRPVASCKLLQHSTARCCRLVYRLARLVCLRRVYTPIP